MEIGSLPLFNEDLENAPPSEWENFRAEMAGLDGVIFFTPEYNRSMPGCLKNAIDVGSRPEDHSIWDGMPTGVVSVSPYKTGAFGANHALRQTFVFLNMPTMQQPEAYVGGAGDLFDHEGKLTNDQTSAFLEQFMSAFAEWAGTLRNKS